MNKNADDFKASLSGGKFGLIFILEVRTLYNIQIKKYLSSHRINQLENEYKNKQFPLFENKIETEHV